MTAVSGVLGGRCGPTSCSAGHRHQGIRSTRVMGTELCFGVTESGSSKDRLEEGRLEV